MVITNQKKVKAVKNKIFFVRAENIDRIIYKLE